MSEIVLISYIFKNLIAQDNNYAFHCSLIILISN